MADDSNGTDETDSYGRHPWRGDRYVIARTRQAAQRASTAKLRTAVYAALDHAEILIDAAERHTEAEWQFQRAQGATAVITTIGQALDE